jgi:hypothetical protein
MLIPEVYDLGAQVLVFMSGTAPFEGHVTANGGDGTQLDRNAEWYSVEPDEPNLCLIQPLEPAQVKRIVRATTPSGEVFEGVAFATIRDQNQQVVSYNIGYRRALSVVRNADAEWVQPL